MFKFEHLIKNGANCLMSTNDETNFYSNYYCKYNYVGMPYPYISCKLDALLIAALYGCNDTAMYLRHKAKYTKNISLATSFISHAEIFITEKLQIC